MTISFKEVFSLSVDQRQRESMGSFARICANVGMYAVVVGIVPHPECAEP